MSHLRANRFARLSRILVAAAVCWIVSPATAQDAYPVKIVRLVIPFGAGGITDVVGRLIGQRLGEELNASVIIENKPGAGGSIAAQNVAQAEPDGGTMLLGTVGTQVVNKMVYPKLPYDPAALSPVSLVSNSPYVLAIKGIADVHDLKGLADYARRNPDKLNFGSAGHGSSPHLGVELFKLITKTKIVHVPFKSGAEAVNAALAGQVQIVFDAIPVVMPQVTGGLLEALALADATRSRGAPDLPTSAEQGLPDFIMGSWNCLMVPAGTPQNRIDRLTVAITRVLARQDVIDRLAAVGIKPLPTGAAAYQAHLEAETAKWSSVVEAAKMKIN
jgi:tripartite-type tricarboxylate transporter receptor subunit TctC